MLSDKDKQGYLLMGVVAIAVIGILAVKFRVDSTAKPGSNNCVGTPARSTVIVLDRSETVTQQTLSEIRARALAYVRDSVQENELVTVFTVTDLSKNNLAPIVSVCRPPQTGNRLTENTQVVAQHFSQRFEMPLDAALSVQPGNSPESPLAQALTDISLSQYLSGERNTLLVFSDMLENTPRFSLYGCQSPEEAIRRFRASRSGAKERPDFHNTFVVLNLIPRLDIAPATLSCRDKLWLWFFGDDQGDKAGLDLKYLPGGPAAAALPARS